MMDEPWDFAQPVTRLKDERLEYWNTGIMGTIHSITLKNTTIHGINNAMDRKNINRGFKKLRVWQDAVALDVLACKIFANFPCLN